MTQQEPTLIIKNSAVDNTRSRKIKSFVLRTGRFSQAKKDALADYWQDYGIDYQAQILDFSQIFLDHNPVVLEIGFGMGYSLVTMAEQNPNINYLGIEVHTPGVGACIDAAHAKGLKNLKLMRHDAIEVLNHCIADKQLAGVQLFFPDPWHKTKHHKRRIVQPNFVELLQKKLVQSGFIHMATDWKDYASYMLKTLQANPKLTNTSATNDYIERPSSRPYTKFEARGEKLGHGVWDLLFINNEA